MGDKLPSNFKASFFKDGEKKKCKYKIFHAIFRSGSINSTLRLDLEYLAVFA